jgi:hypothetical protein
MWCLVLLFSPLEGEMSGRTEGGNRHIKTFVSVTVVQIEPDRLQNSSLTNLLLDVSSSSGLSRGSAMINQEIDFYRKNKNS